MSGVSDKVDSPMTEAIFHALLRTLGLVRQVMEPYFARFGISGPQWAVLRVLHDGQRDGRRWLPLKDVGRCLLIQPPSVTGVVDRLERQGLVERHTSPADLRVRRVNLTPAGRKLVAKVLAAHGDQIRSLFAGLRPQEQEDLLGLLGQLEAHLGALAHRQHGPGAAERKPAVGHV